MQKGQERSSWTWSHPWEPGWRGQELQYDQSLLDKDPERWEKEPVARRDG